jgi:hypothetical protein
LQNICQYHSRYNSGYCTLKTTSELKEH